MTDFGAMAAVPNSWSAHWVPSYTLSWPPAAVLYHRLPAATGGAGLEGGSAGDLMRSSMQQGALANQLIKTQGNIQENAYQEQVVGYQGMQASSNAAGNAALQNAQAAQTTGVFGLAGGVLGVLSSAAIIGAVASIL